MDPWALYPPRSPEIPVVANLPHSGQALPPEMIEQAHPEFLQALPNTDWHLDQLYRSLPDLGITMLQANYSRYCVDLNRSLQPPYFGNFWRSVIAKETALGQPIYRVLPTEAAIQARIEQFYKPYHEQLAALLQAKIDQFGKVYLFDLHSFLGLIDDPICLGNADGKTCSDLLMSLVEHRFAEQGYSVVKNKVFTGGYITRHYGQLPQVEALQIELRYTVYLDADQLEQPHPPNWQTSGFAAAQQKISNAFGAIVQDLQFHG